MFKSLDLFGECPVEKYTHKVVPSGDAKEPWIIIIFEHMKSGIVFTIEPYHNETYLSYAAAKQAALNRTHAYNGILSE